MLTKQFHKIGVYTILLYDLPLLLLNSTDEICLKIMKKKLKHVFVVSDKAEETIRSAIVIANEVVNLDILERHKKKILTKIQWLISETHGKYTTKYCTEGALGDEIKSIQHEHVFPRKKLSFRILNDPSNTKEYLSDIVGRVVTVEEHDKLNKAEKLNPELDGWERYKAAGIVVYNMEKTPPEKLKL